MDEDPQALITFEAIFAKPASCVEAERRRAEVIIEFFRLNKRKHLLLERAQMIMILGSALDEIGRGIDVSDNERVVERTVSEEVPHTACSRAFKALWDSNEGLARDYYRRCRRFYAGTLGATDIIGP